MLWWIYRTFPSRDRRCAQRTFPISAYRARQSQDFMRRAIFLLHSGVPGTRGEVYKCTFENLRKQHSDIIVLASRTLVTTRMLSWVLRRCRTAMTPTAMKACLFHQYCDAIDAIAAQGDQERARICFSVLCDVVPDTVWFRKLSTSALKCFSLIFGRSTASKR